MPNCSDTSPSYPVYMFSTITTLRLPEHAAPWAELMMLMFGHLKPLLVQKRVEVSGYNLLTLGRKLLFTATSSHYCLNQV